MYVCMCVRMCMFVCLFVGIRKWLRQMELKRLQQEQEEEVKRKGEHACASDDLKAGPQTLA